MARFVADIRSASRAMDRPAAKVGASEAVVRSRARRALYAARNLAAGEVVNREDVLIVRPEGPLAPGDLGLVLGRQLKQPLSQFEALCLNTLA